MHLKQGEMYVDVMRQAFVLWREQVTNIHKMF